jgi:hypothetical protein
MHTAELPVSEPSFIEVEIAVGKSKRYKSSSIDKLRSEIQNLINCILELGRTTTAVEGIYYCTYL